MSISVKKKQFIQVIKQLINNSNLISYKLRYEHLSNSVLSSFEPLVSDNAESNGVVISLTTYSKRINTVHITIESLGAQTRKADRIILWLDKDEFSDINLPAALIRQKERGLEIRYCENFRSYKKLIPTLSVIDNDIVDIITVDDDIIYPIDLVDRFVLESKVSPGVVLCNRGHQITFDENSKVNPYCKWKQKISKYEPGFEIFPTGIGGVFYPKGSLNKLTCSVQEFTKLAPKADDVWFKAMTTINHFKSKVVERNVNFNEEFFEIDGSQDIGLFLSNVRNNENDVQITSVFKRFQLDYSVLQRDD
ncbi:hypothetical protein L1D22_06270 [Vibrio sp. Isolate34]|uniref:hypothetical protein n=1 Tax=Vibrio sp. Isolate34 TaxID=2908540 RepID=UPI001EFCB27C|nr:hypothetical protein [Vibrio sp. Isolate34]MCG9639518.1 hypothetical protein [Vibrio sp. Isolate34]